MDKVHLTTTALESAITARGSLSKIINKSPMSSCSCHWLPEQNHDGWPIFDERFEEVTPATRQFVLTPVTVPAVPVRSATNRFVISGQTKIFIENETETKTSL